MTTANSNQHYTNGEIDIRLTAIAGDFVVSVFLCDDEGFANCDEGEILFRSFGPDAAKAQRVFDSYCRTPAGYYGDQRAKMIRETFLTLESMRA
jgi:hypothetical protein